MANLLSSTQLSMVFFFLHSDFIFTHILHLGTPCDAQGYDLPPNTPPPPPPPKSMDDYSPYAGRAEFEMADFIFHDVEMSAGKISRHMDLLAALYPDSEPPFANEKDLYTTIDETLQGDVPWKSFEVVYTGNIEEENPPPWKTATYDVWHRDILQVMESQIGNPDFAKEMDYAPKRVYKNAKRQYTDLLSGNWAWEQAVSVYYMLQVPVNGATLGSDCERP
jgi:hypothetical protein